jgi:hypothetical protein
MSWTLYQNYYAEKQKDEIYSFATPHLNEGLTIFFEGDVIKKLVPACETDKVAVCSWKLARKMRIQGGLTAEMLDRDFHVMSFTKNGREHRMLGMANTWHPEFIPALKMLFEKMGLGTPKETKNPIYQNHYMAKTEIYRRYVSEFLSPAMELIKTDEQLNEIMMRQSNYSTMSRDADNKSVKSKLGLDYYPLCPFVLERCPSLWFDMHRIPVTYL